jgi:hypothetical protein
MLIRPGFREGAEPPPVIRNGCGAAVRLDDLTSIRSSDKIAYDGRKGYVGPAHLASPLAC